MSPRQIRRRSLDEHRVLEERLARLERAASAAAGAPGPAPEGGRAPELAGELAALQGELERHLGWEEGALSTALAEADAWGRERAARVGSGHEALREVLDFCRQSCAGAGEPRVVARRARDLAALVRATLRSEERDGVRPEVLRDDIVAIDPITS